MSTVSVASIVVTPSQSDLYPTQTLRLTAVARDASGAALQDRPVEWSSSDVSIAWVSSGGEVLAQAPGQVEVRATAGGVTGTATLRVLETPTVDIAVEDVELVTVAGSSGSTTAEVAITANGGVALTGLRAAVSYGGGASGWLTASLDAPTTPTVLRLTASPDGLAPGVHQASVEVSSATLPASPAVLEVRLEVAEAPAVLSVSPQAVGFATAAGGAAPPPQAVQVLAVGGGELSALSVSIDFPQDAPAPWLGAALDRTQTPAEVRLTASGSGLAPGVYEATLQVHAPDAANSPVAVRVRLTVGDPPPAIHLEPEEVSVSMVVGGTSPGPVTVAVQNAGAGSLGGLSASTGYPAGAPTGWLSAVVAADTAPTALTLSFDAAALEPGTWSATVQVSSAQAGVAPRLLPVTIEVRPDGDPPPQIGLTPDEVSVSMVLGEASPASVTIQVENTGGGALEGLSAVAAYPGGQPSGWLTAELAAGAAPTSLAISFDAGSLALGTWSATVEVASDQEGVSPRSLAVTLTVLSDAEPPPPELRLTPDEVGVTMVVEEDDPEPVAIAVENVGGGTIAGLSASTSYPQGTPTGWLSADLDDDEAPTSLTLDFDGAGLPAGTYSATVTVTSEEDPGVTASVAVSLVVQPADPDPDPDPTVISIGSITFGTHGGPDNDRHVSITLTVRNQAGNPVAGADVVIVLSHENGSSSQFSATTSSSGSVSVSQSNAPTDGCFSVDVTSIVAEGAEWDGITPDNEFCR